MTDADWSPRERALLDRIATLSRVNARVAEFWLGRRARLAANAFTVSTEALTTAPGETADTIRAIWGGVLDLANSGEGWC